MQLQILQEEYEANIKKFHTELKQWREEADVTRKYMDEIKSLVQYLKVI
jgi:hypothetical protein